MSEYRFETLAFAPDSSGWRVAVEWRYIDDDEHDIDHELYQIVGWVTQEQREFYIDSDAEHFRSIGDARVMPAIFDPEGGYAVVPIDYLSTLAHDTSNIARVSYTVLAPDVPTPEGYESRPV